jgi:hypothetical protein
MSSSSSSNNDDSTSSSSVKDILKNMNQDDFVIFQSHLSKDGNDGFQQK